LPHTVRVAQAEALTNLAFAARVDALAGRPALVTDTGIIEGQYRVRQRQVWVSARKWHLSAAKISADSNAWGARVQGRF
jgi:hypothetical protein